MLVKAEKNLIMRKNVYGIFRALRHFGVSEAEIDTVAKFYKTWLHFPIEEKSVHNWVYCLEGSLVSLPFPIDVLFEDHLIGYAIGNKVFSFLTSERVRKDDVESHLLNIKDSLDKRMIGVGKADIQVHLPTREEAELVFTTFAGNWLANVALTAQVIYEQLPEAADYELEFPINNQISNMWVKPDADDPEKTAIKLGFNNSGPYCKMYRPKDRTKATVCAIIDLRKEDFIGKLNRYGTPTKATIDMYYELLEKRC